VPALPPVPNVIKHRLHFDVGTDSNAIVLLHSQYLGSPPSNAQMNTFCAAFNSLTSAEWPLYMDTDTLYLGNDAVDLTSPTAGAGSASTSVGGTRTGSKLGASTAVLVSYPISRRYRGGKPRSYLPWGTSDDLGNRNIWDTAVPGQFHTGWSAILSALAAAYPIGAATFESMVSVSYYGPPNRTVTGSTGRVRTLSTTRVTPLIDPWSTFNVSPKLGSQRRRNLQRT
jgi:hypothetical protein